MDNLLQLIGNQITPDLIKAASGTVGVSEAQTKSAFSAGIPALVGSLLQQGTSLQGAQQLMQTADQLPQGLDLLGNVAGLLGGKDSNSMIMNLGGTLLSSLMGKNESGVLGLISSLAGTDSKSSSSLMKMLMPLGIAVLGKIIKGQKLDAAGLIGMLMGQKDFLKAAAPAGLTRALGIESFDDIKAPALPSMPSVSMPSVNLPKPPKVDVKVPEVSVPSAGGLGRWLWPLVALVALAALAWWFLGRGGAQVPAVSVPEVPAISVPAAVCTDAGALQKTIDGFPAIAADTQVSAVKDSLAGLRGNVDKVMGGLKAVAGLNIPGLDKVESSLGALETVVNGLAGDTLGDAAEQVNKAFTEVKTVGGQVVTGLNCK